MKTWRKVARAALGLLRFVLRMPVALVGVTALAYLLSLSALGGGAVGWLAICGALAFGVGGCLWCGMRPAEIAIWAVGFRVLAWLVPFDMQALTLLLAACAIRFGVDVPRLCTVPLRRTAGSFLTLALAFVACALFVHHIDAARIAQRSPMASCAESGIAPRTGTRRVATLGDSSTYGVFVPQGDGYPSLLAGEVVNCAFPGAASADLGEQMDRAERWAPDAVSVMIGPNDHFRAGWEPNLRANLTALVERQHAAGRDVLILTYPYGSAIRPRWLTTANAIARDVAASTGARLVDAEARVRSPLAFLVDDVHPSALGHRQIAELLARALAS